VHVLIVLIDLLGVGLGGKPRQPFLEDVNSQWLIASDNYVESQVELVSIDKQWVCNILRNDTSLVHIHIIDVIDDVDTFALARVGRLDDPHIFLTLVLLQFLEVVVEVTEFIRQDVGVGGEVKGGLSESFLETHNVEAETVLAGDLVTVGEVIDLLVFV